MASASPSATSATNRDTRGRPAPVGHIAEVQRTRAISAMLAVACECGAANVTVGDVVSRAGVSRRTFYELFASAHECLLAAVEQALACAREYVCAAHDPAASWQAQVRAGVEAFLAFVDEQPAMGRVLVVESLAAGPQAVELRANALAQAVEQVDRGRSRSRAREGLTPLTAEGAVGGVLSVLHARLLEYPAGPLLALAPQLAAMVVLPYLGAAAAREELARPPARRVSGAPAPTSAGGLAGLGMRLTYRTLRVLSAISEHPGASNREIGRAADIEDQGQISKLLRRLRGLGLIENGGEGPPKGAPNAWTLTPRGEELQRSLGPLSFSGS